jgi:hypothetical protein
MVGIKDIGLSMSLCIIKFKRWIRFFIVSSVNDLNQLFLWPDKESMDAFYLQTLNTLEY